MGYYNYGIYGGDDTQTKQIDYMKFLKINKNEDVLLEYLKNNKTIVPKNLHENFFNYFNNLFKKMNKKINNEDVALEWVLLAKLYIDNKLKFPKKVKELSFISINYLIDLLKDNKEGWKSPLSRRRVLNKIRKQIEQRNVYIYSSKEFYN